MKRVRPALGRMLKNQGQYGCGAAGGSVSAHHIIQSSLETFGPNSAAVIMDEKECVKHEVLIMTMCVRNKKTKGLALLFTVERLVGAS